jgi:hypothetical protein
MAGKRRDTVGETITEFRPSAIAPQIPGNEIWNRSGKAAQISLAAYCEDVSLCDAALSPGFLTAEQFDS